MKSKEYTTTQSNKDKLKLEKTILELNNSNTDLKLKNSKLYSEIMFLRSDFIILEKKIKRSFLILYILIGFVIGVIIKILIKGV